MARDKDFSLISVNEDDDQEIVIQAGVIKEKTAVQKESSSETLPDPAEASAVEEAEEETDSPVAVQDTSDAPYQGTTLEDLKSEGPAPKIRLAVLGVAFLVIIICVVYYVNVS